MRLWLFCEDASAVLVEKRISPLRFAPVEMTISVGCAQNVCSESFVGGAQNDENYRLGEILLEEGDEGEEKDP